jgi:DNA repair protein RadC
MLYGHLSDIDLLAKLIGVRESRKLYKGSLQSLFASSPDSGKPHETCAVARELVLRLLQEDMQRGDVLSSPGAVRDYLKLLLTQREHEVFVAIFLDAQHRVVASEEMFRGTLTSTSVYPREVLKAALRHNAAAIIFSHNHPSGLAEPSNADRMLTDALKQALSLIDVRVLDHLVVAGASILSFAERGLI